MTDLYKWKRHESRLKARMKDSDSIQAIHQWLRKVENATDAAITTVVKDDLNLNKNNNKLNSKKYLSSHNLSTENTDAYSEAHDLLNQWITDKIRLDMDDDIYNYVNISEMNKFDKSSKYLEELLNDQANGNSTNDILHISGLDYDKYDETYIAKDIVSEMMKKNYVDTNNLLKLDEKKSKNVVDVRAKIELRHQQVKENREKRLKEQEEKRKEKLAKKEAELQAKQLVMKEENDKRIKINIEQQLIEQEVEKLRKEMAEQRRKEEELKKRQQELEINRIEKENQEYLNQKRVLEIANTRAEVESKRKEIEEKRNEDLLQSYLKAKKMRILQKTFSAWFDIVVDLKIKSGKARALYDWKISYRYFNAWKKINLTDKIKKLQKVQEDVVKIENIKISKAVNYYNIKTLKKFFDTWKDFIRREQLSKQLEEEKSKAKSKIQMFLEAASQGRINKTNQETSSEAQENDKFKKQLPPRSQRSVRTPSNKNRPKSANDTMPLHTPSTIRNESTINDAETFNDSQFTLNIPDSERDAQMSRQVRKMMWPWVKTPFVINNFENRYKAHDKLLQEQQKMIKEQQRLIEDLKYQQNQTAFKEQITLLEQIKQKQEELERMQKAQYNQERKLLAEAAKNHVKFKIQDNNNENDKNELEETSLNQTNTEIENNNNSTIVHTNDRTLSSATGATSSRHTPTFLKSMEERAKQREQLKREREEKRRQQENVKLKELQLKQEEKMRQEEEERRKKNEELKEKRRIDKERKDKLDAEKRREQLLNDKSDAFYKKYLMRHYCLNGFQKLIEIREQQNELAIRHHELTILKKCVNAWRYIVNEQISIKNQIADNYYKKYLLNHYFKSGWKNFKISIRFEEAKAARFYRYNLKVKYFKILKIYTEKEKLKFKEYDTWLDNYYNDKINKKYFIKWKEFPNEIKKQREREKRLNEMRKKVQELVPDFQTKTSLTESTTSSYH